MYVGGRDLEYLMELSIEQALQQGVTAHREGKLQDAERFYWAILQSQPAHPDANHNLGVLAVSVNKAEAALPLFKTALEANPKIEQFWLSYIDALIKTEKVDDAKQALADAQQAGVTAAKLQIFEDQLEFELPPSSQIPQQAISNPLHSHQGELSAAMELRETGKYKEAQEWLCKFVQHNPANPEALSLLSQVLLLDKKEVEAEKVLTAAASINSELPSVYRNQARFLLKQSKAAEALEKAQLGCRQSPEEPESLLVLAACLGANQKDLEALSLIEKILKAKPNYAEAYANRALIKLRAKDTVGAIEDAEMTVSLKPHLTQMWQLLSSLYYQANNLSDAIEALRRAHKNEPENTAFMIQLGEFLRQENKASEAINMLEQATGLAPKDAAAWTNLGVAFQQEKRMADAKIAYEKALALNPESAAISSNLGAMAKDTGDLESALHYFARALEIEPNLPEAHSNLGVALKELGRLDEALASHTQAIALKPDYAEAHSNLGVTLKELGRLDEALASYTQAIALKPDYAEAHYNLGNTLKELGRLDEALASCNHTIAFKPDYAEAHNNLGVTLHELGRLDEALASYNQAITFKPDYAEAHLNLCELLEKMNRTDEVLSVIRSASGKIFRNTADFLYFEALIEFRKENYKTAEELVKKININELLEKRQPAAMQLQGDLYHYNKDYCAAFQAYKLQNEHVKDSPKYRKQEPEKFFVQQRGKVAQIEQLQERSAYKSEIKPSWIQPTFLIGFPRSGTTLLDTILRTHSNIDVLEELPMLRKMNAGLGDIQSVSKIEAMDYTAVKIASGFYLEELKKHIEVGKKQTIVDKLPLNVLHLPLINQVFPNARYIIALRHPLDCVLSCWMQNFQLNPAMANMVELKRIVDFYDTAMSILKLSKERYSLETHRIRYEDLVLDFEDNVTNLLTFLGLEWEEALRNYQKTALAREKINTPSHSQVIKPIYRTASYRWKNYEKYMRPYKSRLVPWIKEYGYSS